MASVLSRAADQVGDSVAVIFMVTVLIMLLIICSRETPRTQNASRLRIGMFFAIGLIRTLLKNCYIPQLCEYETGGLLRSMAAVPTVNDSATPI